MKQYKPLLDYWKARSHFRIFSPLHEEKKESINIDAAESFLDKYWINDNAYKQVCEDKISSIINLDDTLPEMIFDESHELLPIGSGCLFVKDDFELLRECMIKLEEIHFYVIQQKLKKGSAPLFQMKFPVSISWSELMSGDFISEILFGFSANEYIVIGESGKWLKYVANDFLLPVDIYAFDPSISHIFKQAIILSDEEKKQLRQWLPLSYKTRLKTLIDSTP